MSADLVAKVKGWRRVEDVSHPSIPDVGERLAWVQKFLQEHGAPLLQEATHTVLEKYPDWWAPKETTHGLCVSEDGTLDILYRCISDLYSMGIPLTLAEQYSREFKYAQDVVIWGTSDVTVKAEELIGQDSPFMKLFGEVMGELYPQKETEEGEHGFLDVVIFDSTGKSITKDIMTTSMRLVWPKLVVNDRRAPQISDYLAVKFKASKDKDIKALEQRMHTYSKDNTWDKVFSEEMPRRGAGMRMPLCDRVSPAPIKVPENRPFKPLRIVRFSYNEKELLTIEPICDGSEITGEQWMKVGCIRQERGTPLTDWVPPKPSTNSRIPERADIRTKGGSGGPGGHGTPAPEVRDIEVRILRSADECNQTISATMGSPQRAWTWGRLVWKQDGNEPGSIEFDPSSMMVRIAGKAHQIRELKDIVDPLTMAPDPSRSAMSPDASA